MVQYTIILYNTTWRQRVKLYEFMTQKDMIDKFLNDKEFLFDVMDSHEDFRQLNGKKIILDNNYGDNATYVLSNAEVNYNDCVKTIECTYDKYTDYESAAIFFKLPL